MDAGIFFYINAGAAILLIIWIFSIELRLKKFFKGKNAESLEDILLSLRSDLKKLNANQEETEKYLETVERRLRQSIQHINTVRFNPFKESGSNQSFAVAFLDQRGDGIVISSLYSREKVSVYAKPIKNRASAYPLSEEEKEAIKISKNEI